MRSLTRKRFAALTAAILLAAAALAILPPWLAAILPPPTQRRLSLASLDALESAYPAFLIFLTFTAAFLIVHLIRARPAHRRHPRAARCLLLTLTTLLTLAAIELSLALLTHRRTTQPTPPSVPALPTTFPEPDDPTTPLIVALGESSAEGMHYERWLSVGSIVADQIQEVRPDLKIEFHKIANRGDTLESQLTRLAQLRRRPSLIILYCGHNELAARFSWSREVDHYLDTTPTRDPAGLLAPIARASKIRALIHAAADRLRVADIPPPTLHRPLVDVPNCTSSEIDAQREAYAAQLDALAVYARQVRASLVIIVPPANDAGFEPSRSVLPRETPRAIRDQFAHEFQAARDLQTTDPSAALNHYHALESRFPGFAETHFQLGRLLADRSEILAAAAHFAQARDHDALPMRALTSFNDACRALAHRHQLPLVDGQTLLSAASPTGLLDDHMFHDGMHPSLRGHVALAQGVLDSLSTSSAPIWPANHKAPTLNPTTVARAAGMSDPDWAFLCERAAMFANRTASLRFDPEPRWTRGRLFSEAAQSIHAGTPPDSLYLPGVGFAATPKNLGSTPYPPSP